MRLAPRSSKTEWAHGLGHRQISGRPNREGPWDCRGSAAISHRRKNSFRPLADRTGTGTERAGGAQAFLADLLRREGKQREGGRPTIADGPLGREFRPNKDALAGLLSGPERPKAADVRSEPLLANNRPATHAQSHSIRRLSTGRRSGLPRAGQRGSKTSAPDRAEGAS